MTTELSPQPSLPALEGAVPDPAVEPFATEVTLAGDTALLTLTGEFDVSSAKPLRQLMQTAGLQSHCLLVDMGLVSFVDSHGFAPIAEAAAHRRSQGLAPIVLQAASPATLRLLRIIGFGALSIPDTGLRANR